METPAVLADSGHLANGSCSDSAGVAAVDSHAFVRHLLQEERMVLHTFICKRHEQLLTDLSQHFNFDRKRSKESSRVLSPNGNASLYLRDPPPTNGLPICDEENGKDVCNGPATSDDRAGKSSWESACLAVKPAEPSKMVPDEEPPRRSTSRMSTSTASCATASEEPRVARSLRRLTTKGSDFMCSSKFTELATKSVGLGEPEEAPGQASVIDAAVQKATLKRQMTGEFKLRKKRKTKMGISMNALVVSPIFELVFAVLILANGAVMMIESQYRGFQTGYTLGYPLTPRPASEVWPWAEAAFIALDMFFGIVFTIELVLKVIGLRRVFFCNGWNWFDLFIIVSWMFTSFGGSLPVQNPMVLRLFRIVRLLRLLKLVKAIQLFDVLHLLVASLRMSAKVCMWSLALLLFFMFGVALVLTHLLEEYVVDDSMDLSARQEVFDYFGTFTRSILSMFELTLGNWIPITRCLQNNVSEWYVLVILIYQGTVVFAVLKVINGIFLHETFKAVASDDDLLIRQKERQVQKNISKMAVLFSEADESNDGYLCFEEFASVLQDPRVKNWLACMDCDLKDADAATVYELLEQDVRQPISAQEFVGGFLRLKGVAKAIDMVKALHETKKVQFRLEEDTKRVEALLVELAGSVESLSGGMAAYVSGRNGCLPADDKAAACKYRQTNL
eukprot:TRINITY_DN36584_c0_g1_i1.p1 TRINITY_DN36584_c0_g1~~TRINITY_DN36584_c0_g1_i1.p1  ORF type:complete len:675 (+),score=135.94 TRINITY_DN36584_c0_g1_i1:142-2166(+)